MNKEATLNKVNDLIDQRLNASGSKSALDDCVNDHSAVQSWRNYHLIGDVIRGEVNQTGNCLISKIGDALEQEPTILAPVRPASSSDGQSSGTVTPLTNADSVPQNDTLKSAGMFAIAASVALFAVLAFTPAPVTNNESVNVAAVTVPEDPVSAQTFEAEFGQMLVEHGEFTSTAGMNGLVAYAKLVSNQSLGQ
ncbi:MAG: sigma-E factor negative regulatory protein [Acidiferrobacterales bacterium]|nr:sigma-E factor negative regulatory protein [Acidiferrobacterales bacterium]